MATGLLLLVLGCILLMGSYRQSEPSIRTIQAEEFILKDSSGRTRATLSMKDDKPEIDFYSETGTLISKVPDKGFKAVQVH
jgi:hypothetical protein